MSDFSRLLFACVLLTSSLAVSSVDAAGTSPPVPKPTLHPVADIFMHFETGLDGTLPRFELDRAWFGGQLRFDDVLMLDVVFDGARFADLAADGQPTPLMGFIARAFAEVRPIPGQPKLLWLRGGQTWTFLVPLENRTGGYRQVAKGWADRHGLQKSRDLGVSLGVAPWGGRFELDVGVFNGGGFKLPELDPYKQLNAMVVVRPLRGIQSEAASLFAAGHVTWEPWQQEDDVVAHRLGWSALLGIDSPHMHAGFEVHRFSSDVASGPGATSGIATYVHPTIPIPGAHIGKLPLELEGLARLDVVDRADAEHPEVLFDAGVGVALARYAAVSVDYGFTGEPEGAGVTEHRLLLTGRFRYAEPFPSRRVATRHDTEDVPTVEAAPGPSRARRH